MQPFLRRLWMYQGTVHVYKSVVDGLDVFVGLGVFGFFDGFGVFGFFVGFSVTGFLVGFGVGIKVGFRDGLGLNCDGFAEGKLIGLLVGMISNVGDDVVGVEVEVVGADDGLSVVFVLGVDDIDDDDGFDDVAVGVFGAENGFDDVLGKSDGDGMKGPGSYPATDTMRTLQLRLSAMYRRSDESMTNPLGS